MTHVMVDLETWGKSAGCALRSIGAVVFHPTTGELGATFYRNIDRASCEALGLHVDPETEQWWTEQSVAAQKALDKDQAPVADALLDFCQWWAEQQGKFIWSHGANFDEVILRAALEAATVDAPWDFWNVRCCRTVLALGNRKPNRTGGTHHNALDDAIAQAKAVAATLRAGIAGAGQR